MRSRELPRLAVIMVSLVACTAERRPGLIYDTRLITLDVDVVCYEHGMVHSDKTDGSFTNEPGEACAALADDAVVDRGAQPKDSITVTLDGDGNVSSVQRRVVQ